MQKNYQKISFLLLISISLLTSCSLIQDSGNDQINQLQDQVNSLATQNAALQDQLSSSGNQNIAQTPTAVANPTQMPPSTPTQEFLPIDPVPAGVPIVYDGWSMMVSKELVISRNGEEWGIEIYLQNLGDTDRVFRYMNAGVTPRDDLGNVYEYINKHVSGGTYCEAYRYEVKNLEIQAEDTQKITTNSYCSRNYALDWWQGPIPLEASQITISFEDFGPFDGIEVFIDL